MLLTLTRGVDAATLAALEADALHPAVMVDLDWPGGVVRAHSGVGVISWEGAEWQGVGAFGSVRVPEEGGGLASVEATLRLMGTTEEVFETVDDPIRGHPGRILVALTTERAGRELIGQPVELYAGAMDSARVVVEGADGDLEHGIEVSLAGGPGARSVASIHHSAEERARVAPGDTAGRHVIHALARTEVQRWPEK